MPKLLFFSYKFPPLEASCCTRAGALTKYLARDGWEITVVTPDPALVSDRMGEEVSPPPGLRRLLTGHRWQLLLRGGQRPRLESVARALCRRITWQLDIENAVGWLPAAEAACRSLTPDDVDVVLATGPPFTTFRIAARIARRLGRPYVLDYRDPWTGNPHRYDRRRPPRRTEARERRLLQNASAANIVSPSWASQLQARFDVGAKLHVIGNGFDPEELAVAAPRQFGHFAIVYTGVFYPPKRSATPVMQALARLKSRAPGRRDAWRFHYFGPHGAHVLDAAKRCDVQEQIVLHGVVPRPTAVAATRGADVAVVVTSTAEVAERHDLGIVTGKVYEPIGHGTPVLLIAPEGSDARLVVSQALGGCFTAGQTDSMAAYLQQRLDGGKPYGVEATQAHAWPRLARRFGDLLHAVRTGDLPAIGSPSTAGNVRSAKIRSGSEDSLATVQ